MVGVFKEAVMIFLEQVNEGTEPESVEEMLRVEGGLEFPKDVSDNGLG